MTQPDPTQFHTLGISTIECGHPQDPKRPLKPWAHATQTINIPQPSTHYGVVCGAVSGNLECIDYDRRHDPYKGKYWDEFTTLIKDTAPDLYNKLLIEMSGGGGYHVVYRCPETVIPSKLQLAGQDRQPPADSPNAKGPWYYFEALGEVHYFVCAGSKGYELVQGSYNSIPSLTAEERELLIRAAQSCTELEPPSEDKETAKDKLKAATDIGYTGLSPLDDYNERGDALTVLKKHKWQVTYERNGTYYLRRPGKHKGGHSATFNHGPNLRNSLYVFSSNTEFQPGRKYSASSVYGILEHHGDFKAAAKALSRIGYGKRSDGKVYKRTVTRTDGTKIEGEEVEADQVREAVHHGHKGDGELAYHLLAGTMVYDPSLRLWYIFDHEHLNKGHWGLDKTKEWALARYVLQTVLIDAYDAVASVERQTLSQLTKQLEEAEYKLTGLPSTEITPAMRDHVQALKTQVEEQEKTTNAYNAKVRKLHDVPYAMNALRALQSLATIEGSEWDSNPDVLGVRNGVVDLRTGTLRPAQPNEYIRRIAPTEYDPQARAPRWQEFISEIHNDDAVASYMHTLLGYGITGHTSEHIWPILYGEEGRNGKDTMLNAISNVLGWGLCKPVSKDTIITSHKPSSGAPSPELYDLWGARLVWVNETEEHDALKTAQLKELSGGSLITCRPLHGAQVVFKPTHLGFLVTNRLPHAPADDNALWARVAIIEYAMRFVEVPVRETDRLIDKSLPNTLNEEARGILKWMVDGARNWYQNGLKMPQAVANNTRKYRVQVDHFTEFVEECTTIDPHQATTTIELYKKYEQWCTENRVRGVYGKIRFGKNIQALEGVESIRDGHGIRGRGYKGIGLVTTTDYKGYWNEN